MSSIFIVDGDTKHRIKSLGSPVSSGGEGDIYRIDEFRGCLAKIYHRRNNNLVPDRRKIEAMIKQPPKNLVQHVGNRLFPLFAWPTHVVEDEKGNFSGFLMPEISINLAVKLSKYTTRILSLNSLSEDDRSLPRRFEVCRNLSAAIADLHSQGHYFVDLKPDNILMFKSTGIVCLIDNDGFSVRDKSGKRFPAQSYTQQYLAPELLNGGLSPQSIVDDTQDRFALAALMFQILNNGIHPFQGTCLVNSDQWNVDYCVRNGFYPYGFAANTSISPMDASTHECWKKETRHLFDRAFASRQIQSRPSALEWKEHFDTFIRITGSYSACANNPDSVIHIHLTGLGCPECHFESLARNQESGNGDGEQVGVAIPSEDILPPPDPTNIKWLYWIIGIAVAVLVLIFIANSNT